ncbi:MAG: hypothetical protein WAK07_00430, partial [Rhodomicrobium sp.]
MPAPRARFRLLKAVLTGLVPAAAAMLLYVLPSQEAASQTPLTRPAPTKGASAVKMAASLAQPAALGPGKEEAAPPPILIPAANVRPSRLFTKEEMTAALQPLLSFKISEEDGKAVKEVFEAAAREDDGDARAAISKISAPAAKKFAEWKRLRQPQADFQEAMAFRLAHPLYPELPQDALNEKNL